MANIFLSLPTSINGIGAPVNVSAMGAQKSFVVKGSFSGVLIVEISVDGGITWCPITNFTAPDSEVLPFAADLIRVRSTGADAFKPFTPMVDIGANDDGGLYAVIPTPPINGIGAAIDITAFGNFTTLIVGGLISGIVGIELSENGVDFSEVAAFQAPGCVNKDMVGSFARAVSRGVQDGVYAPTFGIGAINENTSPTSSITIQEEGADVGTRPILNFIGAAVAAVDDPGNDRVNVTITAAALTAAAPTQIDVGDTAAVGVATDAARADHQHALPAPAVPAFVDRTAAQAGVSATVARADHKHDVIVAPPITVVGASNTAGAAASLARSDHQHRLELTVNEEGALAGARPTINFIGSAVTAVDNGGTDSVDVTITATALTGTVPTQIDVGDVGAVGVATDAARADHEHALPAPAAPVDVDKSAAQAGAATTVARADHKHDVSVAAPITVTGAINADGVATSLARSDHQHRLELTVNEEGALAGARPILNFIGVGLTAVDNGGTDSVDVTLTGAFPVGTVAAPGLFVDGNPDTGFYQAALNTLSVAAGGVQAANFSSQGILFPSGTMALPGLSFITDNDTGFYQTIANTLSVSVNNTQAGLFTIQGFGMRMGTAAAPSLFVIGDTDTGIYPAALNQLAVTLGGSQIALFGDSVVFSKAAQTTPVALTYGANIAVNAKLSNLFTVTLAGATAQLDNPSNLEVGQSFSILVTQDAVGLRALTFGTFYSFGAEGVPVIATSLANIVDVISCLVVSPTKIACTALRGF